MATTVIHTIKPSGGDYTSLSAWEAAQQRDLVALDEIAVAECYAFEDTTRVTIDGWTTDATRNIIVRPAPGAQAQIPWSTSAYRLKVNVGAGSNVLSIVEPYTQIERIQIQAVGIGQDTTFGYNGVNIGAGTSASGSIVSGCYIKGDYTSWSAGTTSCIGIVAAADINGDLFLRNNVIEGFTFPTLANGIGIRVINHSSGKTYIDNCTIVNCGSCLVDGYSDMVVRNTLVIPTVGGTGFGASFGAGTNYNASSDATAIGANSRTSQTFTFRNAQVGDYRLRGNDTGARGFGVNLSSGVVGSFTTDFFGQDRNRSISWDIGADQADIGYGSAVGTTGGSLAIMTPDGSRGQVVGIQ
jgi:hypothetical protein